MSDHTPNPNKSNWRDLPAGNDLDRYIAEYLGWTVVGNPLTKEAVLWHGTELIHVEQSHSELSVNIARAWNNYIPQYSTDVNAALTLPMTPGWYFSLRSPIDDDLWTVFIREDAIPTFTSSKDENPALALCHTWLNWKDGAAT